MPCPDSLGQVVHLQRSLLGFDALGLHGAAWRQGGTSHRFALKGFAPVLLVSLAGSLCRNNRTQIFGSIDIHVDAQTPMEGPWSQFSGGYLGLKWLHEKRARLLSSKFGVNNASKRSSEPCVLPL